MKNLTDLEVALKLEEIEREEPKQEYESECICNAKCKGFTNVKCKKPKQETLEEVAERLLLDEDLDLSDYDKRHILKAMVNMAKWQQERRYSEGEVKTIINDIVEKHCTYFEQKLKDDVKLEWFEQFKKKEL